MPKLSRRPSGPYEERIDFEGIARAQDRRQEATLTELRNLLFEIQRRTLRFVDQKLVKPKSSAAIAKYRVPLAAKYREILRKRITAALRAGLRDVAAELDFPNPRTNQPLLNRARARADLLAEEHLNRLRSDLQKAWAQAMIGKIDKAQMEYVTRKTFAEFAGWVVP